MYFLESLAQIYETALKQFLEAFTASMVNDADMQCWLKKKIGHSYSLLVNEPELPPFWLELAITPRGLTSSAQYTSDLTEWLLSSPAKRIEFVTTGRLEDTLREWSLSDETEQPTN